MTRIQYTWQKNSSIPWTKNKEHGNLDYNQVYHANSVI